MKVLVIGGGGREHAIVRGLRQSKKVQQIVCAPGNAGIASLARCAPLSVGELDDIVRLVEAERPGLTVIGPELPLAIGAVDELTKRGFRVFGPTKAAARLETSKAFAKAFMQRHGIPTAAYVRCTSADDVRRSLAGFKLPVVVKADGLAAGKGVVICTTFAEAERSAAQMFSGELLGSSESEVVIEEFLSGEELSFFAVCDGRNAVALASAQDHKRIGEGDTGPNTGGMGAFTLDGLAEAGMEAWLLKHVAQPVVDNMAAEGNPFRGILFCGMMMVPQPDGTLQPMVLEFNTRFGDPETQAILVRLETDLVEIFDAAIDGTADRLAIRMRPGASACVIAASGGYPGKYTSGRAIAGLETLPAPDTVVFHSGTAVADGEIKTAGGRVLAVTAFSDEETDGGAALRSALAKAYATLEGISFEGMQYRRDIGWRALQKSEG